MIKFGKGVVKYRIPILVIAVLLLIPSVFGILNTRINHAKSTILNTNLTQTELRSRYTDRIASRLFGECKPLLFQGMDVRLQKLQ